MKKQNKIPLIQMSWVKIKDYLNKSLSFFRKIGKGILKIILKISTIFIRSLYLMYIKLSKFAHSKQSGFWIIFLINLLLCFGFFIFEQEQEYRELLKDFQIVKKDYEKLLNEYDDLYIQINEMQNRPKPQPTTKQEVISSVYVPTSVEHWRYLVVKYFPPEQTENALAIMDCESKGDFKQVNENDANITGYPSCGLFQINGPTNWEWDNPEINVARAAEMFSARG